MLRRRKSVTCVLGFLGHRRIYFWDFAGWTTLFRLLRQSSKRTFTLHSFEQSMSRYPALSLLIHACDMRACACTRLLLSCTGPHMCVQTQRHLNPKAPVHIIQGVSSPDLWRCSCARLSVSCEVSRKGKEFYNKQASLAREHLLISANFFDSMCLS